MGNGKFTHVYIFPVSIGMACGILIYVIRMNKINL